MEIKTKTINKNKWTFVNEYWETSYAWGHKTNIIKNSYDYGAHKVRYYNRTWECYTYQTCMYGALNEVKQMELNRYIDNYKYENNITRFKRGEKQKVIEEFNNSELGQELQVLYDSIRLRDFD